MKKIDLKYLKKKFNLEKFLSLLNKNKKNFDNHLTIYYDVLNACSDKVFDYDKLFDELNGSPLEEKLEDSFLTGKFLPMISENFILTKTYYIAEPKTDENESIYDEKHTSFIHQILNSKQDSSVYVLVYQGFDYTNDGYYCREKFKLRKDAEKFIKKEHILLKKDFNHYLR